MALRYTGRIIEHLAHTAYEPANSEEIARRMRIPEDEREAFTAAISKLASEKKLIVSDDGRVRLPSYPDEITGRFKLNARGFGFVVPDQPYREGDLFVPPGETGNAVSRDRVRAKVIRDVRRGGSGGRGRSGFVGRIVEVVERGRDNFVGTLVKGPGARGHWFVEPDGRSLHEPVLIRDPHVKNAKAGDKVVIELLHYPEMHYVAEGVITQVLGEAGRPDVETQAVIVAHGLRTEFPREAIDEARRVSREFEREVEGPWPDREDVIGQFTFTIDPPDARDFDDAISIDYDAKAKRWTLGVHIADVAHFVRSGSALDTEAKLRGTSVYLPRFVIPMLPEILSNGVCSLQEGVNRFTKSVFITLDDRGTVVGQRVAATVIRSRKRLTYLEAQALIDGDPDLAQEHARAEPDYSDELIEKLHQCNKLARILEKRRQKDGMIVLDLPEVELVFDEDGHVIDAVPEDDAYTHKVIEMFMVEANEALARTFDEINIPVLRRVHPDPAYGDMAELQMYAMAAGQSVPDEPSRFDLQRILDATRRTPAARAIHFAVLRTLAKAHYSPALIGHFALASDHYAHFTSPIRRYPDLSLHRALLAYLELTDNGRSVPRAAGKRKELSRRMAADARVPDEGQLVELGRHCSEMEVEAEFAERELRSFLVLQFLHEKHMGDEFPGVITGVSSAGVFVQIERYLVEGLVATHDLPQSSGAGGKSDRWIVSETTGRMYAQRSGTVLAVGDIVRVQIASIDLATRHLNLLLTQFPDHADRQSSPAEPRPRRRAAEAPKGPKSKKRPKAAKRTTRRRR